MSDLNNPTDSQMHIVKIIESNLKISFTGKTKQAARQFITDNIEKSKQAAKDFSREKRKMWNDINFEETHRYNEVTKQYDYIDPRDSWDENDFMDDYADRFAFDPNW